MLAEPAKTHLIRSFPRGRPEKNPVDERDAFMWGKKALDETISQLVDVGTITQLMNVMITRGKIEKTVDQRNSQLYNRA